MITAKATILIDIKRTKHTHRDEIMAREVDMRDGKIHVQSTDYIPKAAPYHKRRGGAKSYVHSFVWSKQLSISSSLPMPAFSFLQGLKNATHVM